MKTVTRSSKLGPAERADAIAMLRDKELDILVIGGGIVGTGAALDAVTRGLRVGMVEARDWASGTSSRSSSSCTAASATWNSSTSDSCARRSRSAVCCCSASPRTW